LPFPAGDGTRGQRYWQYLSKTWFGSPCSGQLATATPQRQCVGQSPAAKLLLLPNRISALLETVENSKHP